MLEFLLHVLNSNGSNEEASGDHAESILSYINHLSFAYGNVHSSYDDLSIYGIHTNLHNLLYNVL